MKTPSAFSSLILVFMLASPGVLVGQVDPSLTIYDVQGTPYTALDNSTVFSAVPGASFTMELAGTPSKPYGLFMALYQTPFPTNIVPPPLFIMPPIIPVLAGPDLVLGPSGSVSFNGIVPQEFAHLPYNVDLYFQGFVGENKEIKLSNGIKMEIIKSLYKADVAVARGESTENKIDIFVMGRIQDGDAGDNKVPGPGNPGLSNGVDIEPDKDIKITDYFTFEDYPKVLPEGSPVPSNNMYLSGIWPLVPGDAGIDDRFKFYPKTGSHLHIHTRDRICRNNENENMPFIIVPVYEDGVKVKDLNVYQFRDNSTEEYGYMVLDVQNNDFYELKGTRKKNTTGDPPPLDELSPWDPYVAISPDGKFMAAVRKDHSGDFANGVENLYIIKLDKDDVWPSGLHAQKAKLNSISNKSYAESRIFAETLTFAGDPPHTLFFACNRNNQSGGTGEPPIEAASVLWSLNAAIADTAQGQYKPHDNDLNAMPKTGKDIYKINYFGSPKNYQNQYGTHNELTWIRSEDNSTICLRAAGRYYDEVNGVTGEYVWEVLAITNIKNAMTFDVINLTGFWEPSPQAGWKVHPFGSAYNGFAKASLNPSGTLVAFVDENLSLGGLMYENLYLAPTDGSKHGVLKPLTGETMFLGDFLNDPMGPTMGRGVHDPFFVNDDELVFFCGKDHNNTSVGASTFAYMDLFLYRNIYGTFRNLTLTMDEPKDDPDGPFTKFGDIRPEGLFPSRDGRYLFFLRGFNDPTLPTTVVPEVNLAGVDMQNGFSAFDLTGSEFSGGFIPRICMELVNSGFTNLPTGAEMMNFIIVPVGETDVVFFTAKYAEYTALNKSHQVFMVNLGFPLAAFPVTSFDPVDEDGWIDNLVADDTGNFIAFSRSDDFKPNKVDYAGGHEKLYVVDLNHGAFTRELTRGTPYDDFKAAAIDGSLRFIPSPSPDISPVLIYGMGLGNKETPPGSGQFVEYPDNPHKARIWLYPLENVAEPGYTETLSYPLTEQNLFLVLNALPF